MVGRKWAVLWFGLCDLGLAQYMALAMGQELLVALVEIRPSLYVLSLSFHLCFSSLSIVSLFSLSLKGRCCGLGADVALLSMRPCVQERSSW